MLRLQVEAIQVSSFETEAAPGKDKEKGAGNPDTRFPLCTQCTTCNWTA